MLELPQYAESLLNQPIPSLEKLAIEIQAVFQPFIDALKRVAQAIGEALQPLFRALHKLTHPYHSRQERHFLTVIRRREQKKHHVVRAKRRRPAIRHTATVQGFAVQVQHFQSELKPLMIDAERLKARKESV